MTDTSSIERLADVHYELRLVCFFDTLGWKHKIDAAGIDPQKIARLALVPRLFSSAITALAKKLPGAIMTSFSDNVVVSIPYDADRVLSSLESLAKIQLGLAMEGFFLRGAVTIGLLFHDDEIVFGPALNRAYQLESKTAIYPRVLLDGECSDLTSHSSIFLDHEGDQVFIDPFKLQFVAHALSTTPVPREIVLAVKRQLNITLSDSSKINPGQALVNIFWIVQEELSKAICPDVVDKYQWLSDRITPRVLSLLDNLREDGSTKL